MIDLPKKRLQNNSIVLTLGFNFDSIKNDTHLLCAMIEFSPFLEYNRLKNYQLRNFNNL